jgi:hypothetical protein
VAALRTWFGDPGLSLEGALGVGRTWRRHRLIRRRDELIGHLAARYPHLAGRALARKVDEDTRAYERHRWPRDRDRGSCSEADGYFFDLVALRVGRLRFTSIRTVLAKNTVRKYPGPLRSSASETETDHAIPTASSCDG